MNLSLRWTFVTLDYMSFLSYAIYDFSAGISCWCIHLGRQILCLHSSSSCSTYTFCFFLFCHWDSSWSWEWYITLYIDDMVDLFPLYFNIEVLLAALCFCSWFRDNMFLYNGMRPYMILIKSMLQCTFEYMPLLLIQMVYLFSTCHLSVIAKIRMSVYWSMSRRQFVFIFALAHLK